MPEAPTVQLEPPEKVVKATTVEAPKAPEKPAEPKTPEKTESALEKEGCKVLTFPAGEIGTSNASALISAIQSANEEKTEKGKRKYSMIKLVFGNCPGGNIDEAEAIRLAIIKSEIPIWGVATGHVQSSATDCYVTCHRRVITTSAEISFHHTHFTDEMESKKKIKERRSSTGEEAIKLTASVAELIKNDTGKKRWKPKIISKTAHLIAEIEALVKDEKSTAQAVQEAAKKLSDYARTIDTSVPEITIKESNEKEDGVIKKAFSAVEKTRIDMMRAGFGQFLGGKANPRAHLKKIMNIWFSRDYKHEEAVKAGVSDTLINTEGAVDREIEAKLERDKTIIGRLTGFFRDSILETLWGNRKRRASRAEKQHQRNKAARAEIQGLPRKAYAKS